MGQLLWTCGNGTEFQAERAGFRLIAGRAPVGTGYRYVIRARHQGAADAGPLASGSRESLREAFEAAEQALATIEPSLRRTG